MLTDATACSEATSQRDAMLGSADASAIDGVADLWAAENATDADTGIWSGVDLGCHELAGAPDFTLFDASSGPAVVSQVCLPGGSYEIGAPYSSDPPSNYLNTCSYLPAGATEVGAFCIDTKEVSIGEYNQCVKAGVCKAACSDVSWSCMIQGAKDGQCTTDMANGAADLPARWIRWEWAREYCEKWRINSDLPSSAEWELAARWQGGCGTAVYSLNQNAFVWGDHFPPSKAYGNFKISWIDDGYPDVAPVGTFFDPFSGLYDMAGNVMEWVLETYSYEGIYEVSYGTKGGHFNLTESDPEPFAIGCTQVHQPSACPNTGFRCVTHL